MEKWSWNIEVQWKSFYNAFLICPFNFLRKFMKSTNSFPFRARSYVSSNILHMKQKNISSLICNGPTICSNMVFSTVIYPSIYGESVCIYFGYNFTHIVPCLWRFSICRLDFLHRWAHFHCCIVLFITSICPSQLWVQLPSVEKYSCKIGMKKYGLDTMHLSL